MVLNMMLNVVPNLVLNSMSYKTILENLFSTSVLFWMIALEFGRINNLNANGNGKYYIIKLNSTTVPYII